MKVHENTFTFDETRAFQNIFSAKVGVVCDVIKKDLCTTLVVEGPKFCRLVEVRDELATKNLIRIGCRESPLWMGAR